MVSVNTVNNVNFDTHLISRESGIRIEWKQGVVMLQTFSIHLVPFQTCLLSCFPFIWSLLSCSCSSHQMYWDCSSVEVGSNANKDCYSANVSHLARSCWLNVQGLHMPRNPSWICRCFKTVHCQAQLFMWPCLTDWQKGNLCVWGPCWFLILTISSDES